MVFFYFSQQFLYFEGGYSHAFPARSGSMACKEFLLIKYGQAEIILLLITEK